MVSPRPPRVVTLSKPSIVTRFTRWIRSLPVSPWVSYPALFAIWVLFDFLAYALAGTLPQDGWTLRNTYDIFGGGAIGVSILAFYYYLDRELAEAADDSRDISGLSDSAFARVRHELIVIPLWPHLIVGVVFGAGAIQGAMFQQGFTRVTPSILLYLVDWVLTAAISFGLAFRIVRLIALIGRFYAGPIKLNLYNLPPLYELSSAVARAGLFLLVLWYVVLPLGMNEFILGSPAALASAVVVALVPLAAFLIPHAVLGRRLAREKTRLAVDVSLQLQSAFEDLKHDLEAKTRDDIANLKAAIEALIAEKKFIDAIPTLPWRLGTFRVAATAVFLPILVWVIQQLLDRYIGF